MRDMWVGSLVREDPLEKEMATYSSILWEINGQRSLAGYSPWGHKKSDTTERTHTHIDPLMTRKDRIVLQVFSF